MRLLLVVLEVVTASWRKPALPTKPCRVASSLVGNDESTSVRKREITRTRTALPSGQRGHRTCSPSRERDRFLQLVLYSTEKGHWAAFDFRSESLEPYSLDIHVQDAHSFKLIESQMQYEDWFCDGRSKRRLRTHQDLARTLINIDYFLSA